MNAFSELRRTLYRRYSSGEEREQALAAELLTPDFAESTVVRAFLGARKAVQHPDPETISALLKAAEPSDFLLRYLADALCSLGDQDLAEDILTEALPSEGAADDQRAVFGLRIAAECGFGRGTGLSLKAMILPSLPVVQGDASELYAAVPKGFRRPLVLQSVFYGDPLRPGRGSSGGIGALVLRLGNVIAAGGEGAATLASTPEGVEGIPALMSLTEQRHLLCRLPLRLPEGSPEHFLPLRNRITHAFRDLLRTTDLQPGVVHVRFIDDASLAVVKGAVAAGLPAVMTLTPDPHRLLCGPEGGLRRLSKPEELILLHRLWVGDELLERCKGVMGIGRESFETQLLDYFPQLEDLDSRIIAAVDEGVPDSPADVDIDLSALLTDDSLSRALSRERLGRPAMLTVGRLATVKNQASLAEAWARGFWRTHNLVIIGGDLDNPSPEESRVLESIEEALGGAPSAAAGCVVHLPGIDADTVARIEAWFGRRTHTEYPDLYIAPSFKEEFGLAILEAMGAGLVACAPIRGGAQGYIRQGINGFLVDTRNAASLERELSEILRRLRNAKDRVAGIRRAAVDTVRRDYSLKVMAERHADFYRRVRHDH